MDIIKKIYILLIPFIIYFMLDIPFKTYQHKVWGYKIILIYIAGFFTILSVLKRFPINDNYILPALLFINIGFLIYITLSNEYNIVSLIPLIGIVYLLYIFNFQDFRFKDGILINVNRKWILSHIVILISWYLTTNKSIINRKEKFACVLWILYPLLFPMKEYWIHRVFMLTLVISFRYGTKINNLLKNT